MSGKIDLQHRLVLYPSNQHIQVGLIKVTGTHIIHGITVTRFYVAHANSYTE